MTCTFPNCDCVRDNLPLCKKSSIHAIYPTKAGFVAKQRLYTEAELHAAIAAKNAQILDLIEALRRRTDGEICGCGVDNPTDVCLSHYDVIEAVVRNRVQVAIAAAMVGAVKRADGIAGNTKDYDREHRRAAGQIGGLIKASIPTDATAALEAVKAQVRDDTVRSAAIAAGNAIVAIAAEADPDISPLRKQMLRVKMEKAVKAAFTRDA